MKTTLVYLLASVVMFTSGCFRGTFGSNVTETQKAQIVKGKTTKIEVLQELGNPDQKIDLGKGQEQFSYIKETVKAHLFTPYAHMFGRDLSEMSTYTEFWVVFDNDVVVDFGEKPTTKTPKYFK